MKTLRTILTFITICCIVTIGFSQERTKEGNYLGYSKPDSTPEIFAPDFVSTQYAEFAGTFTPDFSEYYFTRRGSFPNGLAQIMVTKNVGCNWSTPVAADFSSNNYEFEPYVTPDGMRLYFGSRRPIIGKTYRGEMHQWYLEKDGSAWSEPKLLGSPFFEIMVMYPTVSNNGTLFFTSTDGIYYSELISGVYQEPVKLGPEINFLPLTAHSFIAPDESYLIFDGQPRGEGKTDIFISYKKQDGSWTKGKFMGKEINSGESQALASVSPDRECLFFTRNSDIYWMDASIIDNIKLIPEITIEEEAGIAPKKVQFSVDLTTVPDSIIAFEWDFDNNGVIDSRLQNPEFTYIYSGTYSVKLKVFTASDTASKVFKDLVEVRGPILNIHYLGHSAFVLQFDNGISIVTDYGHYNAWAPAWDSPIYDIGNLIPDVMTYSHFHEDHYDPDRIPDSVEYILTELDSLNINGINITPIRVCESSLNVEDNTAYLFTYKGLKILHLGDAQAQIMNIEDETVQEHIKEIIPDSLDLLFMTIEGQQQFIKEAEFFVDLLKPRRIIPMHYWSSEYKTDFLSYLLMLDSLGSNYEIVDTTGAKYIIRENDSPTPVMVISLTRSVFVDNTSVDQSSVIPVGFRLFQNYPNPFSLTTNICYSLPKKLQVKLIIHNAMGNHIALLVDEKQVPGTYEVRFNNTGLSTGLYYYQLIAGSFSQTKTMILNN